MQTFLPSPNFLVCARVLDRQRLGKQRVEALQILNALTGQSKGWRNHPATKMWEGSLLQLCRYGGVMCMEWTRRGYVDNCHPKFEAIYRTLGGHLALEPQPRPPHIFDNPELYLSHQSNLVRKLPEHYRKFFPDVPDNLPYVWPTR